MGERLSLYSDKVIFESCEVDKEISVVFVPLHVSMFYQPLNLFLDHLLGRNEHVLEYLHQLRLQSSVAHPLAHLHNLHNSLLHTITTHNRQLVLSLQYTCHVYSTQYTTSYDFIFILIKCILASYIGVCPAQHSTTASWSVRGANIHH